jgi:dihydrodipicolinate synthase/N-acetylneuraminate lyase
MRDPWLKRKVIPIAELKAWSEVLGLAGGPVRAPLLELTAAQREELRCDLERVGLTGQARGKRAAAR